MFLHMPDENAVFFMMIHRLQDLMPFSMPIQMLGGGAESGVFMEIKGFAVVGGEGLAVGGAFLVAA